MDPKQLILFNEIRNGKPISLEAILKAKEMYEKMECDCPFCQHFKNNKNGN